MVQIKWSDGNDAHALAQVFYDAVRLGPSPYTQVQRVAWMPHVPATDVFRKRLARQHVAVAHINARPVGFLTLDDTGYLDLAFILAQHRGRGLFRMLYDAIETRAAVMHLTRLHTHASLSAQPAFQSVGFCVIQFEMVTLSGVHLRRAEMEKHLI